MSSLGKTNANMNWNLSCLKGEAANAIIKSLDDNPDEWKWWTDSHSCTEHVSTKLVLSVSDSSMYVYKPYKTHFGWIDWFRLRRAFKRWKKNKGRFLTTVSQKKTCLMIITNL